MHLNPPYFANLVGHVGLSDTLIEALSYLLLIEWRDYDRKAFVGMAKKCRDNAEPGDAAKLRELIESWHKRQAV